jgi:hypothetical protein
MPISFMKKAGVICLLILAILITASFALAEDENATLSDSAKVDRAYQCLEDKVKDECSTSLQDNIFTLLAIGKCSDEVIDASDNENCWPDGGCSIKTTAQAILALDKSGHSTSDAEDWLLEQNKTPSDITWYLEIESPKATTCDISYGSETHSVVISDDKKISSAAGSCLTLSDNVYWLKISPSCYNKEFEISCDEQFLTTLLFKKQDSLTIHVSEETSSSSAEGTTTEKVNSFCFTKDNTCDYEGSLWATLVLDNLGYDVSAFTPYLITMADENNKNLPESFLYLLTGSTDFRSDLLLKQKNNQYWDESGDKFYDTALALYPFQYEDAQEKSNSEEWLFGIQGKDGCWDNGKIMSNAFILYSLWPRGSSSGTGGSADCESAGYYCMSGIDCPGNILDNYACSGVSKCCDTPRELETCENQLGDICASGYTCAGGVVVDASDTVLGEQCCVSGTCQLNSASSNDCESSGGACRTYGCNDDEEESFTYTCNYGDTCCVKKTSQGNYWWLWLLSILIILLIIAIIFRNKLRPYYYRVKSMFKKGGPRPGIPPSAFPASPRGPIGPRRIFPPSQRQEPARRPVRKSSEIDEVLKKLKEMGK